jgi:hypothetical protein
MEKLATELATLNARATLLESKRVEAQNALDSAVESRQRFLLEGDIDDEKVAAKLQTQVDGTASTLAGYDRAITALVASVAEVEDKLTIERMAADCKAASETLFVQVDVLEKRFALWLSATRDLAAAAAAVGPVSFETDQVGAYLRDIVGQVETALSITIPHLRTSVLAIRDGHLPIPRAPEVNVPEPMTPAPPLTLVFSLHALQFTDHNGALQRVGKWNDVELPAEAAERALRNGKAAPVSDPRRGQLRGYGGGHPQPHWCFDLDREPAPESNAEPELHPAFTVVDRGPGFKIQIAR